MTATRTQMEAQAQKFKSEGLDASVTKDGRHIIAISPLPEWAKKMKASV